MSNDELSGIVIVSPAVISPDPEMMERKFWRPMTAVLRNPALRVCNQEDRWVGITQHPFHKDILMMMDFPGHFRLQMERTIGGFLK